MEFPPLFVHTNQLQHLLHPEHYLSATQFERELRQVFVPGWHCLATRSDLPRHGDFLTCELFGRPLQIRNIYGHIHAFLNLCAHRHCLLTHEPCGHDERFRCQYHGWEYDADGHTRKIPEAGCFRPFDRESAQLKKFRAEAVGELVFVSLSDDGPTLAEYLGKFYPLCREWYGSPFGQRWSHEFHYQANWKVVVENSLESYHVPCLHAKTLGDLPPAAMCEDELEERWTTFHTRDTEGWSRTIQNALTRTLGLPVTNVYTHHIVHPTQILIAMDLMRMVQTVVPVSPTETRHKVWVWTPCGTKNLLVRLLARLVGPAIARVARQVMTEDVPIFADVQRGLSASPHPGVLGTREERIYYFQKFLLNRCGESVPSEQTRLQRTCICPNP